MIRIPLCARQTPEKPQYTGGSWHVEGMMNEAIISTGIYYYDEENITESALAFRSAVSQPGVWQDDSRAAVQVYGINRYVATRLQAQPCPFANTIPSGTSH